MSGVWAAAERKHISLEVQCHEELTALHDPKWTAEAVGNLLDNAVKYTPDGGTVQVTVEPWQFYTKLTVSDTGIGIDEVITMTCSRGSSGKKRRQIRKA